MKIPSNSMACRALFLQAADEGRGEALFGPDWQRTCDAVTPFVETGRFPDLYLEFPLAGEPFLDVTALYGWLEPGTRFATEAAAGTERLLDWFAKACRRDGEITLGFEMDAASGTGRLPAVHFQPRDDVGLAVEFCEVIGEAAAGKLYRDVSARMPEGWRTAYFGMFRGRPGSPLRVCGYIGEGEKDRCARDPACLEKAFRAIGFTAWDDRMLGQVSALMAEAPATVDYQFDFGPDGTPGETFAIDLGFAALQENKLPAAFDEGVFARIMGTLEDWGAADERWHKAARIGLTRALKVTDENGGEKEYALLLSPNWIKARWRGTVLQGAKIYCLGWAGII